MWVISSISCRAFSWRLHASVSWGCWWWLCDTQWLWSDLSLLNLRRDGHWHYVWFCVKFLTEVVQGFRMKVLTSYVRNADDCLPSFRNVSWIPGYSWSFSAPSFQVDVQLLSVDSFFLLISVSLSQNFVENLGK